MAGVPLYKVFFMDILWIAWKLWKTGTTIETAQMAFCEALKGNMLELG